MKKIAVILGTRPEIIKLAPVIDMLEKKLSDFFIIHTNQHYDYKMDEVFFKELGLKKPRFNLKVGSGTHGQMLGKMIPLIEAVLLKEKVDIVVVQGDTNTTLAGAITAAKLNKKVVHIEAGCRSFDKSMPEEINRIVADSVSDICFAATKIDCQNLLNSGIGKSRIFLTGSTAFESLKLAEKRISLDLIHSIGVKAQKYILITVHRSGNVDSKQALLGVFEILKFAKEKYFYGDTFVWPMHPRTLARLREFNLKMPEFITQVEPVAYLEMVALMKYSKLIFTDSGGVQEEAYFLKIPCITLRNTTEWPYTVERKANFLVTHDKNLLDKALKYLDKNKPLWKDIYGSGISEKIVDNILSL